MVGPSSDIQMKKRIYIKKSSYKMMASVSTNGNVINMYLRTVTYFCLLYRSRNACHDSVGTLQQGGEEGGVGVGREGGGDHAR